MRPAAMPLLSGFAILVPLLTTAAGGEPPAAAGARGGVEILNTYSFWRCHLTLRPPLFDDSSAAPAGKAGEPAAQPRSQLPPADWMSPEFDDGEWWRDAGPFFGGYGNGEGRDGMNQTIGLMCLRGKFTVRDPAAVRDLRLELAFRGGAVVYVNGQEAGRSHMPAGKLGPETPADSYPPEAFFTGHEISKLPKDQQAKRQEVRLCHAEFAIAPALLRKGINVLAIEIHRAPMKALPAKWDSRNMFNFSTCGLDSVALRTVAAGAVETNTGRPKGFQVWNADLLQLVSPVDYGDPQEKLHPVRIAGTRGGGFSGQVVASSDAPIRGLRAEVSELRHKDGKGAIPAQLLRVRYPARAGVRISFLYLHPRFPASGGEWGNAHWGGGLDNFDGLAEEAPKEVPVYDVAKLVAPGYTYPSGAVQPIWITVQVPSDAAPGEYRGKVTIRAEGVPATEVPVELRVSGWKLPDPKTFGTMVDMAESPESLALYYDVPLWSDKHFELIGRTFKLLGSVGNDVVYVPLIGETNFGNEHTMVQWIKQGNGYKCDFTVAGKYLDLAEKYMGKPRVVCFQVWDYHLGGDITFGRMYSGKRGTATESAEDGVLVSQASGAGGKPETARVPRYDSPQGRDAWKPLMEGLREFVRKRGLAESATLGMGGDILPSKGVVAFWKDGFPESKWMIQGHGGGGHGSVSEVPADLHGVPVNYVSIVYGARFALEDPERGRMYGWKGAKGGAQVNTLFARGLFLNGDVAPPSASRLIGEWNIEGGQAGIGRLTADFFKIPSKDGRSTYWLPQRYPKSSWKNANVRPALLAPGPDGALSTERFDLIREGLEECEARIYLERVLTNDALRAKLGAGLASRAQEALDERTRANMWIFEYDKVIDYNIGSRASLMGGALDMNWYAASGWRERSTRLFDLAAEAAAALGEK